MARYKVIDTSPRLLAVDLERQLLPGTFEHALNWLIDHELDLSRFDARYRNDLTGASAYPPAMLLKVVLFSYSRGIVSSREIEQACREQVTLIALSGDSGPHFTTLAAFVSRLGDEIAPLFAEVLQHCDRLGLIGREMFAIDGVKLPSNAKQDQKTKSPVLHGEAQLANSGTRSTESTGKCSLQAVRLNGRLSITRRRQFACPTNCAFQREMGGDRGKALR